MCIRDSFYDPHHLSVVRLLKMVVENAHKNGVWVGICGELGADLEMTETFMAIGVDELSVTPRAVLPLRSKIRSLDVDAARAVSYTHLILWNRETYRGDKLYICHGRSVYGKAIVLSWTEDGCRVIRLKT